MSTNSTGTMRPKLEDFDQEVANPVLIPSRHKAIVAMRTLGMTTEADHESSLWEVEKLANKEARKDYLAALREAKIKTNILYERALGAWEQLPATHRLEPCEGCANVTPSDELIKTLHEDPHSCRCYGAEWALICADCRSSNTYESPNN